MSDQRIERINENSLARAAELVSRGELIVVPTDTVYGVACNPFDSAAIDKLFEVKRRPRTKSIQVLLPGLGALEELGLSLPHPLEVLSEAFLPGGFSPICEAEPTSHLASLRHDTTADGTEILTQGIRVPDSAPLLQILTAVGPLAATSANLSGQASATSAQQAFEALGEGVALYLDAGKTPGPVSSTVVAANPSEKDGIAILREGVIPERDIRMALHR